MKRSILLVLLLVLLLVMAPLALAAGTGAENPGDHARFRIDGKLYSIYLDEEGNQIVKGGDSSEDDATLPTGVSYDLETNTLTLTNVNLETMEVLYLTGDDASGVDYWLPNPNLTIKLVDHNTVDATQREEEDFSSCMVFASSLNVTITGGQDSSLTAKVPARTGGRAIRVEQDSALTIAGETSVAAEITGSAESEDSEVIAMGVYNSDLTVQDSAVLTAKAALVANNYSIDVVNGTMTVTDSAQVIADSTLVVGGEDAAFVMDEAAQVTIEDMDEGLLLNEADATISGGALQITVTENTDPDYGSSGIVCNEGSLRFEKGSVDISAYCNGINLNQASMTVSDGELDIDLTAPVNYDTFDDEEGNPYYDNYVWTNGIACNGSTLTMSGGNVTIDLPNGNGIGLDNAWNEGDNVVGTSAMTQSGGTLTITANGGSIDSNAICVCDTMTDTMHNTATFTGGATKLQAWKGLSVGLYGVATLDDAADIVVKTINNPDEWCVNRVSGTLNIYGGSFTVEAFESDGLHIIDEGSYNQTGGTVSVTVESSGNAEIAYPGVAVDSGSMTVSGGILEIDAAEYGLLVNDTFELLSGTVKTHGGTRGMLVVDGSAVLRGGSLNASANAPTSDFYNVAMQVSSNDGTKGSLTITGGTHYFQALSKSQTFGLASSGAAVSFEGGTVYMTGECALLWQGIEGRNTTSGANRITLAGGLHAVSDQTGHELQFVYEPEENEGEDDEIIKYHSYYFTEDNTLEADSCTDVTISSKAGQTPIGYTGSMEITSGQATVGAPVVVKYTVATRGTVSIALPGNLELINGSATVNGKEVSSLQNISVDGAAVIRFSVKPKDTNSAVITATATVGDKSYQTTLPVTASGFQASAPTITKLPDIFVSGHGTPGDKITLEITGEHSNTKTVIGEVSSLGTFKIPVELPVNDPTQEETFTIKVYFGNPSTRSDDTLGATLTVTYDPDSVSVTILSITNIVHNSKGWDVPVTIDVDYANDKVDQSYYTYWPDEPTFEFAVEFDVPDGWEISEAVVEVTYQDGTTERVPLEKPGPGDHNRWKGEAETKDPSKPPVGYRVGWTAQPAGGTASGEEQYTSIQNFLPIMDPSGTVYSGTLDSPVAGATVTLYYGGSGETADEANAYVFNMTNYGQVNPQVSDALGNYAWNVPEGWWQIVATYELDGKTYTAKSDWLRVLPVQEGVGLNLNLPAVEPDEPDTPHKPSGGSTTTTPGQDTGFRDVAKSSYYYDAVTWAVDNGITNGTGSSTFSPDKACTRAEIVTFLWRAAGEPDAQSSVNPFTDVSKRDYFYDAVLWAVEAGITKGTSASTFSPDKTCTRAEAVTFLYRYLDSPSSSGSIPFTDVAATAYYKDAVLWAVTEHVTQGTGAKTFSPDKTCTRAEIATFLYRALAD